MRLAPFSFLLCLLCGCSSSPAPLSDSSAALSITCTDINGRAHTPLAVSRPDQIASVLIFITVDCPIANGYAPELNRIVREYNGSGVRFYFVHVDPTIKLAQARMHANEYGFAAPVLLDLDHALVKAVGATRTPEAAVLGRHSEIVYRGRIDDRYVDFGKKRTNPSQRDLRDVLDAILAGRAVPVARTKAIGCFIPDSS
jgi:hypothetical protein